ncbi:hypothetical protein ACI65C_007913 [Semiaphis heraclei]
MRLRYPLGGLQGGIFNRHTRIIDSLCVVGSAGRFARSEAGGSHNSTVTRGGGGAVVVVLPAGPPASHRVSERRASSSAGTTSAATATTTTTVSTVVPTTAQSVRYQLFLCVSVRPAAPMPIRRVQNPIVVLVSGRVLLSPPPL